MIRFIIFLLLIAGLSSALYLFFVDLGSVEIYFADYQAIISVGVLCVLCLLAILCITGIVGLLWWLKNLPKALIKMRSDHTYKKAVNEVFDLVCALESENNDLAIRLYQRNNWGLITHPVSGFFAWRVGCLNKNSTESDIEKSLLVMQDDSKTCVPAIKELVMHRLKSAEFDLANQYLAVFDKLSYKPTWFYRTKITICLAIHRWDEASSVLEKATKLKIFSNSEAQSLFSMVFYLRAKFAINQNLVDDAISTLKKSVSSNAAHIESVLLLSDLLCARNKQKDALEYIKKSWQVAPDYRLIKAALAVHHDLPVSKRFEELEKLGCANSRANLLLAQAAMSLNLLSKTRKYIELGKQDNSDYAARLEALYKLLTEEDKQIVHDYLDRFLAE